MCNESRIDKDEIRFEQDAANYAKEQDPHISSADIIEHDSYREECGE